MTKLDNEQGREKPEASPELIAYIELCHQMYRRMLREGFPWETDQERDERIGKVHSFPLSGEEGGS